MLFGKTLLITGVSSGIGARTAELASHLGADVVGIDLEPPVVPISSFIQADISYIAAIDKLVAKATEAHRCALQRGWRLRNAGSRHDTCD